MLRVIVSFFILFSSLFSFAQNRCATVEYEKLRHLQKPSRETVDQFESWIRSKITQRKQASQLLRMASPSYVVPVVVHVIHNGEAVGAGSNISNDQILSQIRVLNEDFQRLNADTVKTPSEFVPVAGKFPITFVLAKQDPNGDPTDGILRVQGTQSSWAMAENYTLKALSYWPAENYLNIWIANLSDGVLGYTQLPTSSTLDGLKDFSMDRLTDGVVIHYQGFGTINDPNGSTFNLITEYNLGRTATHEIGHFFGLRHVWGDTNSCDTTDSKDYVYDTPIQSTNYNGTCPGTTQFECGVSTMFSNFLNYTDDACMNIFSIGQGDRMDVVINHSPRRASLLNSPGSQAPVSVANNIALKALMTPGATSCSGSVSPGLLVRNLGTNTISSCQIEMFVNGNFVETKLFSPITLATDADTTLSFSSVMMTPGQTYKFSFQVVQTNNGADGQYYNDTISLTSRALVPVVAPLMEPFNHVPSNWTIINPDGLTTWQNTLTEGSNKAMYMDFFSYDDQLSSDWLISPVIDLTSASFGSVSFDYAYSGFSGINDRLKVLVSSACDFTNSPTEIFNLAGSNLVTTSENYSSAFVPLSSEWTTKTIQLNQFVGQKIQIAFVGVNDFGNNLYLDNVTVLDHMVSAFALKDFVSPSPVSCQPSAAPVISIKNQGNIPINSFTADIYVNGNLTTQQVSSAQIDVSTSKEITLLPIDFTAGNNNVSIVIKSPNGVTSGPAVKDSLATSRYINATTDAIPLRQNFNSNFGSWTTLSPDFGLNWNSVFIDSIKGTSLEFSAFGSDSSQWGKQAWLVSPTLDFSNAQKAIVFFETSYALNPPGKESLRVFYSTDCGQHLSGQLPIVPGEFLSDTTLTTSWQPDKEAHWTKRHVILDALAGQKDVRLAIVATNGLGNNLYLDNIEFFVDDNEYPVSIKNQYAVYGGLNTDVQITFNFSEKQTVRLQVYDLMGNVITDQMLPEMLNQTYTLSSGYFPKGIYVVRVQTQNSTSSTKVLFGF